MEATPTIVRGTNDKPVASDTLAGLFANADDLDGQLFIGYPIIGAADGKHPIDALYISPTKGLVVFDLVEGGDVTGYEDRQDNAATQLQAKLLSHKELVSRRRLQVDITPVTFSPSIPDRAIPEDEDYPVANPQTLSDVLGDIEWPGATDDMYQRTLSALQSISTIRRNRSTRSLSNPDSRGAKLQRLEASIATLDALQSKAVIETVDGVQRIRGLAGSGKTIVLALKTAYLHAQHPNWRIAVTFNTRSLRAQFTRLINSFTIEQTGDEPDWEKVHIIQAWGASGGGNRAGIYHQFCVENGIEYQDFGRAKALYGQSEAFRGVCAAALAAAPNPRPLYDAILVDEAQDFPAEFLRLCYSILTDKKRLVYAYDELQNLSGTGVPSAAEIFGINSKGQPNVTFDDAAYGTRRDIILEKCYRNSRPVLVTAHALGFGTYRTPPKPGTTGLVQIFEQPDLWTDIGYQVISGELEPGSNVTLARNEETSPLFLEDHSPESDLVQFGSFATSAEQANWVADSIQRNLEVDELRYDDIVIINPNPLTTRSNTGAVRKALLDRGIQSHVAGVDTVADVFFQSDSDSITVTGIHRAKGNEAGMVYVLNAEESYDANGSLARVRNRLFTAITRSKAWVRVLGVGPEMNKLIDEFNAVKSAQYQLNFNYPTARELQNLQIVHRDMSPEEANAVKRQRRSLNQLVSDLEAGKLYAEDLDPEMLDKLQQLLGNRNGE